MQAGNFSLPQNRRRLIILAAAPDQSLPTLPEPDSVFTPRGRNTINSLIVDERRYRLGHRWGEEGSAPFRSVTVRDAMSDLPLIDKVRTKRG